MEKMEFAVSEVKNRAWKLTKKHGLVVAVVLFVITMITQTLSMAGFSTQDYLMALEHGDTEAFWELMDSLGTLSGMSLLAGLLNVVLGAGLFNCVIKMTKGEMQNFDLSGFKMSVNTYAYYFLATIVYSLIVGLGTLLCFIPGIFFGVRLIFVLPYILDHPEAGFGDAFKHSWDMTKGHFWSLLGLMLLYVAFGLLGLLCCCIGVYYAAAMGYFMITVAYSMLCNDSTACEENAISENID